MPFSLRIYATLSGSDNVISLNLLIWGLNINSYISNPSNIEPPTKPPIPAVKYLVKKSWALKLNSTASLGSWRTSHPSASAPAIRPLIMSCIASSLISSRDSFVALFNIVEYHACPAFLTRCVSPALIAELPLSTTSPASSVLPLPNIFLNLFLAIL